jgi:hypothetical protein
MPLACGARGPLGGIVDSSTHIETDAARLAARAHCAAAGRSGALRRGGTDAFEGLGRAWHCREARCASMARRTQGAAIGSAGYGLADD